MFNLLAGRVAVVAAAVLWSTGGLAIKLSGSTAPQIAGGRAAVAAVVLFALLPAARARWHRRIWGTAAAYAATCVLFVFANTLTTAGNAIFIQNIAPVWVLLIAPWFLGERSTRTEALSVPISLLGCALFFADDLSPGRLSGNTIAAAASVTYAFVIMGYRKLDSGDGLSATVCGNVLVVLVCLPFAASGPTPTGEDLAVYGYLGAIQQGLAAVLFVRGIRSVSALEGALLILLEPLFSPVWAFIGVGERLGPMAIAGGALIVTAMVWRVSTAASSA